MKKKLILLIIFNICLFVKADLLDKNLNNCANLNKYAAIMAFSELEDLNKISYDNYDKTRSKIEVLSINKIDDDLYKEIYHITFYTKDNKKYELITINNTSSLECSMSEVKIFLLLDNKN